jgi:hypothetical protein
MTKKKKSDIIKLIEKNSENTANEKAILALELISVLKNDLFSWL